MNKHPITKQRLTPPKPRSSVDWEEVQRTIFITLLAIGLSFTIYIFFFVK